MVSKIRIKITSFQIENLITGEKEDPFLLRVWLGKPRGKEKILKFLLKNLLDLHGPTLLASIK